MFLVAGELYKFRFDFQRDDYVITYDADKRVYLISTIDSDYGYKTKEFKYDHIRIVKWIGEVPRDKLSASARNTLGAWGTVFEISKNKQKEEILSFAHGKKTYRS